MQEILVNENDNGQRLDRFMRKYLSEAPRSFIYRMIRKKNIELNGKRAQPEDIIKEGDKIQMFLSDETISKFKGELVIEKSNLEIDIIYEDENIILINKPSGVLSHASVDENSENIVDAMINYLIDKGDYDPKEEHNFIPSICNRLDRNTSGIIIGAKNYKSLKDMNETIREDGVKRYYHTIVKGILKDSILLSDYIIKDDKTNKVEIVDKNIKGSKRIDTKILPIKNTEDYTMLEVELLTGRTHQIRVHLKSINNPIIGDRKYGDNSTNKFFNDKYDLKDQYLHGYKIIFNNPINSLGYLKNKEFIAKKSGNLNAIEVDLFKGV